MPSFSPVRQPHLTVAASYLGGWLVVHDAEPATAAWQLLPIVLLCAGSVERSHPCLSSGPIIVVVVAASPALESSIVVLCPYQDVLHGQHLELYP